MSDKVTVIQADREAAAELIKAAPIVDNPDIIIHKGADDTAFVQAFARHRIAHEPKWLPIDDAPEVEDYIDYSVWNGVRVYSACFFEGRWLDSGHDYLDPQPTHYQLRPTPPEQTP